MRTQIHIRNSSSLEDRARVEQILVFAARKFGFADTSVTSRVPDTIRCYSERVGFGCAIGARVVGELVIVDFYDGKEPSPNFPAVEKHITDELHRNFGHRIYIPKVSEYIPTQHSLTESEAAREFNRRHFRQEG